MKTKKIKISPNLRLNVFDSGIQKKYDTDLTVIFIHGGAGCLLNWRYQLAYFSAKYRTIAYDWRGCGESDKAESYTFGDHYQDFLSLIETLKVPRKPILVGHSYGCLIARKYLSEHLVGKFINVGFGLSNTERGWLKKVLTLPRFIQIPFYRLFWLFKNPFITKKFVASKKTPIYLIRESIKNNKKPPLEFFIGLKTFYQDEPLEWIKNFQEKTLIIGGREDRCSRPFYLEQLWQLIPQAKLEIIQDAGHIVPSEVPEYFNNLVEAFIENR